MTDTGEIRRCDARIADTGNPCIYVAGHGGDHRWPDDGQDHSDEIRYRHVADERNRLRAELDRLRREVAPQPAWFSPQDEHTCGATQPIATAGGDRAALLWQAIALLRRFALHTCGDERGRACGFCDAHVDDHRAVLRHRPDCIYPEAWTFLMQQESQNVLWAQALKIAMAAKETKGTKG